VSGSLSINLVSSGDNRFRRIGSACAVLSALVLIAWLIDAFITTSALNRSTWCVSGLAAGICWFGGVCSLILLHGVRVHGSPLVGALLGMLIRMAIPLTIGAVLVTQGGSLACAGLFGQLVVFYLITLAAETCISVALLRRSPAAIAPHSAPADGGARHG
jgi:hypothetical protein